MAITDSTQLTALKTWLTANAASLNDEQARDALNATASPDYFVWKTELTEADLTGKSYLENDGVTATSFQWAGLGGFILRAAGERDAFGRIFVSGKCNPSLPSVRSAFQDIFSGPDAGSVANRKQFIGAGKRTATVAEKVLAIQTVGGPPQSGVRGARTNSDTLVLDGKVTTQDVVDARRSA